MPESFNYSPQGWTDFSAPYTDMGLGWGGEFGDTMLSQIAGLTGFQDAPSFDSTYSVSGMNEGGDTTYDFAGKTINPLFSEHLNQFKFQQNPGQYSANIYNYGGKNLGSFTSGEEPSTFDNVANIAIPMALSAAWGGAIGGGLAPYGNIVSKVGGGMASGGTGAAMTGQPIGQGIVSGGIGGAMNAGIGGFNPAQIAGITNPTLATMFNRGTGTTLASLAQGKNGEDSLKSGLFSAGTAGVNAVGKNMSDFFSSTYDNIFGNKGTQADYSLSDNPAMNASYGSNYGMDSVNTSLRDEGILPQQSRMPPTSSNFMDLNSIGLPSLSDNPAQNASYPPNWHPGGALGQSMRDSGVGPQMSYAPPSSEAYTQPFNPLSFSEQSPQQTTQGFSFPGALSSIGNSLGNYASNNAGDLASMLYGFYNNRKQQKGIGAQMQSLKDLYSGNSPYAQQMRNKLQASAAARGTRSNTAGREVQLQAALADRAAQQMPTQFAMEQAQGSLKNNQMNMLIQGLNKTGLLKQGVDGLRGLFGPSTQEIPYNFGNVSGSDQFGWKGAGGF